MLQATIQDGIWRLTLEGEPLLEHTPEHPFAAAIQREKRYSANRGTVKEQVVERQRVPLTAVEQTEAGVTLTGEGHSLRVELLERPDGAELRLTGEPGWGYEFSLPAWPEEAVFGGGEQYRQVNLRGERVVNLVSEHIQAATVLQKALLPRRLYREKDHSRIGSYAPMPVFVTDRGRMIRFDTDSDGIADLSALPYRFTFDACPRALALTRAERYEELARSLARDIPNRQYLPDWCLEGMILGVQGGTQTVLDKAFAMLDAGARISAVWCQDWCGENRTMMGKQVWWNWEADEKLYPGLRDAIQRLKARGLRFLAYINPYLVKDSRLYNECKEKGWLITREDGSVYHIKSTTFDAGMLDLTNPAAVSFIKDTLIKRNMLELGISGWMADFGEYLPVDCVLHDGDPALLHNRWPVLWAKLNREAIEEYGAKDAFFFSRSGYPGVQTYSPILWNGDQHTDWTRDYGMPCVMPASFNLGFSGVSLVHSDIGGFFSFTKIKRGPELFIRWMEMAAFSPLMRSHESLRPWANAQFDAPEVLPHTVRLTNIHAALRPYLEKLLAEAREGVPAMRPDFWEALDYGESRDPYSYFLGSELYVCPVIDPKIEYRQVFLPAGDWVHFWTGKELEGGKEYRVGCHLGRIPVFYRKGSSFTEIFRTAAQVER